MPLENSIGNIQLKAGISKKSAVFRPFPNSRFRAKSRHF